ncbi:hypothetical protein BGZ83_007514 [Gryganskiella cystojenkinii]|nr:hypothetical protein BGZ83_007514 [Gryganskiella cystojenkinii]
MIIPLLTKQDLARAACVTSSWLNMFSPHLWHTVKIRSISTLNRFLDAVTEGALFRNGHHIRILDTEYYSVIEYISRLGRTCTGLLELSIESNLGPNRSKSSAAKVFKSETSASPFGTGGGFFEDASPLPRANNAFDAASTRFVPPIGSNPPGSPSTIASQSGRSLGSVPVDTVFSSFFGTPRTANAINNNTSGSGSSTLSNGDEPSTTGLISSFGTFALSPEAQSSTPSSTSSEVGLNSHDSNTARPGSSTFTATLSQPSLFSSDKNDGQPAKTSVVLLGRDRTSLTLVLQRNQKLRLLKLKGSLVARVYSNGSESDKTSLDRVLESLPETIETLVLERACNALADPCTDLDIVWDWPSVPRPPILIRPLSCLKTLQVTGTMDHYSLRDLLTQCPSLENLHFGVMNNYWITLIVETLKEHCPRLSTLSIERATQLTDKNLAELLTASTCGWRTLRLKAISSFENLTIERILGSASTLENLRIEATVRFPSKDIQKLLCTAPRLRRLYFLNETPGILGNTFVLSALDMKDSEWACCETLESLRLMIRNVPRPDINVRTDKQREWLRRNFPTISERTVYDQLSKLKNLRELVLESAADKRLYGAAFYQLEQGQEDTYFNSNHARGFQYDCLGMSLKTGLDELRDLKELRRVGLERMAVRFDYAEERAWVKNNWPKFGQLEKDDFWEEQIY